MAVLLRKRKPTALAALLEITIVMAMGIAVVGAYRGWFNPSVPSPALPSPRVKAQLVRRPEGQTGLSLKSVLDGQGGIAGSSKGLPCC